VVQRVHSPAKQNTSPPASETCRPFRLTRILGALPLIPAFWENRAAVPGPRDQSAVAGFGSSVSTRALIIEEPAL
jgi:hypothetical protein